MRNISRLNSSFDIKYRFAFFWSADNKTTFIVVVVVVIVSANNYQPFKINFSRIQLLLLLLLLCICKKSEYWLWGVIFCLLFYYWSNMQKWFKLVVIMLFYSFPFQNWNISIRLFFFFFCVSWAEWLTDTWPQERCF